MVNEQDYWDMVSTDEVIFMEIKRLGATYRSEIANNLGIERVTVDKWIPRLELTGRIERINLANGPEPHIVARLDSLKAAGMKKNHFKNAKWYRVKE